jgi:carbamoyl-phosphate synthase large subunit
MKSTGEVMGISSNFGISFAKSQLACNNKLPLSGNLFISLTDIDKEFAKIIGRKFFDLGFKIFATNGTLSALIDAGIEATAVFKISEGRPNIEDMLKNGEVALAINTSDNKSSKDDAKRIRQTVLRFNVPYFTTIAAANAAIDAITNLKNSDDLEIKSIQEYLQERV